MKDFKLNVAILGSGKIGTDLLYKVLKSPYLNCSIFIGRNTNSHGIRIAKNLNINTSCNGIKTIQQNPSICDLVFDATSAKSHKEHWPILELLKKYVIDLTPSQIGKMYIPSIFPELDCKWRNINLISCGGQTAIPIAYAIGQVVPSPNYIEVVSSIASKSAGPATRCNIDEYIYNTEQGIRYFSKSKKY